MTDGPEMHKGAKNIFNIKTEGMPGLVSVIIPTIGKRPEELCQAITSALEQTYPIIEVVVVSDGYNGLSNIVESFDDSRVKYIETSWGGLAQAREVGICYSTGQFLAFLDDDDLLYPNHIEVLVAESSPEIIPFSRARYVYKKEGKVVRETIDIEPNNPSAPYYKANKILQQNIAPVSSFLIQRHMHQEVGGFDSNLIRLEDWDFWGRLSIRYKLKFVDVITNQINVNLDKPSLSFNRTTFKDIMKVVGDRVRARLNFMAENNKWFIDDEVRREYPIPLVSVVMPIYNAEKYLREAMDSILNQTLTDFEIIAVNDGSTDSSGDILDEYKDDKRVRIYHKNNEGLTKTLNFGLSQTIGKYIARMDNDDIAHPDRLQLQVKFLQQNNDIALLGTRFQAITATGEFLENLDVELTNDELQVKLLESNRFGHPTVMITRWALEVVGGYDESAWANTVQDYDLWLRIAERFKIANLPEYLLKYRVHATSITQSKRDEVKVATRTCIQRSLNRRHNCSENSLYHILNETIRRAKFAFKKIVGIKPWRHRKTR